MAFISYADYGPNNPNLAMQSEQAQGARPGVLPNILRIHAHRPDAVSGHSRLQDIVLRGPSELSGRQREMIGIVVSQINDCLYWLQHLGDSFREQVTDEGFVARLQSDYRGADIRPADRAMLEYCAKLTRAPRTVTQADVDALHAAGFSDAAIHDMCLVAAYFAFANRIVQGLGIELESPLRGK